ncbi:HAD family hydrolase [Paracoccus albus]|uniref:HAD family hydrolase n=1 Tax=Paracoccus albus TaxID=3017784 RepID=UPI0022F1405D|nr:HAD family phosphatase [Paracoccus albus]WBU60901.1 HAD family phosphatase [Paracoccus albus]
MNIRAIIWDIDGTLVDSEPLHLRALLHVCEHHGADISDLPDDHFVGVNVNDVWTALSNRFPAGLTMADWLDQLNGYYIDHASRLAPIKNAVQAVRQLHAMGIRQGAASNSNRRVVDANLRALGLSDIIELSVSLDDVTRGKPDPQPYLRALDRMGLDVDRTCAVEDSATGVASARRAGMRVIALGDSQLNARYHVQNLAQLPDLVIKLSHECTFSTNS